MTTIGAIAENKNIGAALEVAVGANATRSSAAETEIEGSSVDRVPPLGGDDEPGSHDSVVVLVTLEGEIGAAETLTLTLEIEDAAPTEAGGSTPAAFAPVDSDHQPQAPVVIAGGAGGAFKTVVRYDLRLSSLRRFFRANVTPNFSAAGGASAANFANIAISYVLGTRNVVIHTAEFLPGYDA